MPPPSSPPPAPVYHHPSPLTQMSPRGQAEGGAVLDDDDVDSMAGVDIGKCHVTMPLLEFVYKF